MVAQCGACLQMLGKSRGESDHGQRGTRLPGGWHHGRTHDMQIRHVERAKISVDDGRSTVEPHSCRADLMPAVIRLLLYRISQLCLRIPIVQAAELLPVEPLLEEPVRADQRLRVSTIKLQMDREPGDAKAIDVAVEPYSAGGIWDLFLMIRQTVAAVRIEDKESREPHLRKESLVDEAWQISCRAGKVRQ